MPVLASFGLFHSLFQNFHPRLLVYSSRHFSDYGIKMMTAIEELESQIRDFVNAPRRQAMLLADAAAWAMLCSSLDVIGDAELAIVPICQEKPNSRTSTPYDSDGTTSSSMESCKSFSLNRMRFSTWPKHSALTTRLIAH